MGEKLLYLLSFAFFILSFMSLFKLFRNIFLNKSEAEKEIPYFSVTKYVFIGFFIIYIPITIISLLKKKNMSLLIYLISLILYFITILIGNRKIYFFNEYLVFNGKKISYKYLNSIEFRKDIKKDDRLFISISTDRMFYSAKIKKCYEDDLKKYLKKKINNKFKFIK